MSTLGFEPKTNGLKVQCSTKLSYIPFQLEIRKISYQSKAPFTISYANPRANIAKKKIISQKVWVPK